MNIHGKSTYDYDAIRALTYIFLYKKHTPKKRLILTCILSAIGMAADLTAIAVFGADSSFLVLFVALAVLVGISLVSYFLYPKMQYKNLGKFKGVVNEYDFSDTGITVHSLGDNAKAQSEIAYSVLVKVYETSEYFFLYQMKNQCYIVEKSTLEGGTVEALREKLSAYTEGKYVLCKY